MADAPVVHIGENTAEKVAFELMELIAGIEHVSTTSTHASDLKNEWSKADRKWVLDTYSECIETVRGHRAKPIKWPSENPRS